MDENRPKNGQSGFTIIEATISAALLGVLLLFAGSIVSHMMSGSSSAQAHDSLQRAIQTATAQMGASLVSCKKLFDYPLGEAFLPQPGGQLDPAPPPIAGSQLPQIQPAMPMSPSQPGFINAAVGNSLFFAALDSNVNVVAFNSSAATQTVRIDVYRFYYDYVAQSHGTLGGLPRRTIWQWESNPYIDYDELHELPDSVLEANVAANLASQGFAMAWDSQATTPSNAFYTLPSLSTAPYHLIQHYSDRELTYILGVGFSAAVSPNTSTATFSTADIVPLMATASGTDFPSGFEVAIVGPSSSRQIVMRLAMVAQGSSSMIQSCASSSVSNVRDCW